MNKYQIMSDFELCERIECLHQMESMLTRAYSHAFDENDDVIKAVQKEIKRVNKELRNRDY